METTDQSRSTRRGRDVGDEIERSIEPVDRCGYGPVERTHAGNRDRVGGANGADRARLEFAGPRSAEVLLDPVRLTERRGRALGVPQIRSRYTATVGEQGGDALRGLLLDLSAFGRNERDPERLKEPEDEFLLGRKDLRERARAATAAVTVARSTRR